MRRCMALLQTHLAQAQAESPPESCHALDVSGLKTRDVRFFGMWDGETLLGIGAWKRLTGGNPAAMAMAMAGAKPMARSSRCTPPRPRAAGAWPAALLAI